jgi:hypothetical protein
MLEISRGSLQPMLHGGAANSALLLSFHAEDWKTLSLPPSRNLLGDGSIGLLPYSWQKHNATCGPGGIYFIAFPQFFCNFFAVLLFTPVIYFEGVLPAVLYHIRQHGRYQGV